MRAVVHHVGTRHWEWPHLWAQECWAHGPSFRIPSRILNITLPCPVFVTHNRARLLTRSTLDLEDLWNVLVRERVAVGDCPDYEARTYINPETGRPWEGLGTIRCEMPVTWPMRHFYEGLCTLKHRRGGLALLRKEIGFCTIEGCFGFTWVTKYQYVVRPGGTADDVPEHLQGLAEPVKVQPLDDWPGVESGGPAMQDGCIVSPEGPRGCGHRKEGLYLTADMSPFGALKLFTPMSPALYGEVPERTMVYVDFATMGAAETIDVSQALVGVSSQTHNRNMDKIPGDNTNFDFFNNSVG